MPGGTGFRLLAGDRDSPLGSLQIHKKSGLMVTNRGAFRIMREKE